MLTKKGKHKNGVQNSFAPAVAAGAAVKSNNANSTNTHYVQDHMNLLTSNNHIFFTFFISMIKEIEKSDRCIVDFSVMLL
jgi:hypothetical protein